MGPIMAPTPGQSGPGSDSRERFLRIRQSWEGKEKLGENIMYR